MVMLKTARSGRAARSERKSPVMPVVLEDVPPGFDWGWYSREDPRMHLQVVDRRHKRLKYKVWLESKGKRVIEPVGDIPAKIFKTLHAEIIKARPTIEVEWVHLMIEQGWLTYRLHGTLMVLIAYPNTPNHFERELD